MRLKYLYITYVVLLTSLLSAFYLFDEDPCINDTTPPGIFCPTSIVTTTDTGLCTALVDASSLSYPIVYDACGASVVATGIPPGYAFPVGITTITWTAFDPSGNSSSCTQTVTVTDDENPTITCPGNITVNTNPGECNANVTIPLAIASDNCTVSSVVNNYNGGGANASGIYPIGTTTVTFTVTDSVNRTATCSMDVTVVNNQNPTLTLLGANPITLEACSTYNEFGATANDICFGNISSSIIIDASNVNTSAVGSYNVTYNVTNANGNSATEVIRTVNVVDTTTPTLTLTGPNPITIGDCSTYTELGAVAMDPCFGNISSNVIINNSSINTNVLGTYTVTYNVTDNSGNAASQITRTIIVADVTPPDITLVGDNPQIIEACDPYIELGATANDPCFNIDFTGSIVIDPSSVDTSTPGLYSVTYNVVDSYGNVAIEVIRYVEVINTILPTITCPSDLVVNNDLGACFAVVNFAPPTTTANCPVTVVQTAGLPSGSSFPIGTTTNTFEVTDGFSQTSICSFDVTVNDTENPVTICSPISVQLDVFTGLATITPFDIDNGSSDNCNFTQILSQSSFDCSDLGDNTVTITTIDDSGNSSSCDVIVTVTDISQNASVSISASANTICQNAPLTFTTTTIDGGSNPSYQWQVNGIDVAGATGATFTTSSLSDADDVTVIMTPNSTVCPQSITSNTITVSVNDANLPADAGPDITNTVCTNTTVTLAANPITGSNSTGLWTVTSSQTSGFSFSDDTSPTSNFTGDVGETYILTWHIDNPAPCIDTSDTMTITFIGCNALDFDGIDDNISFKNYYNLDSEFSLEIWIKSQETNNNIQTILSKREASTQTDGYDIRLVNNFISFNWNNGQSLTSSYPIINNRWHHIAVTFGGGIYTLYIDGVEVGSIAGATPLTNASDCIVGAMDQAISPPFKPLYYFKGGMDELRVWNVTLTASQIQKMMNQEIESDNGDIKGSVAPVLINGLTWSNLDGYYQMNQNTDITNGNLVSISNSSINGLLRYMTTLQSETAPIPYQSNANGLWSNSNTWLHGSVQAIPNSIGIDGITPIDWNIVRTSHQISSGDTDITLMGLVVNSNTLSIENTDALDGQSLTITDYLLLNGNLDLVGESQLVQPMNSIVDYTGTGALQRDQQGTTNLFNYNYWSSPVSGNGLDFTVGSVLYDGSTAANPQTINWTSGLNATGSSNPITLSNRWIYTYEDTPGADYFDWVYKSQNSSIDVGLGFTLKGSGVGDPVNDIQNYVFIGKPNNGTISIPIIAGYQALVGNPYPSAIDADQFIIDNGPTGTNSIDGNLYFWEHSTTNASHVLSEYEGGYATYNLSGGVPALSPPDGIEGLGSASKIPQQYVPIGQGFYVTSSASGGTIEFNNGQRVFAKESVTTSVFMRASEVPNTTSNTNQIKRVRLNVKSPDNSVRHLLLAFTPNNEATEGIDQGYDAENTDSFPNDASFMIEGQKFIIQGTGIFNPDNSYLLGLFLSNSGNVEIELASLENFNTDIDVYVYDALMGVSTRINDTDFVTTLAAGNYTDRFYIAFSPTELLSVPSEDEDIAIVNYLIDTNELYIHVPISIEIKQVRLFNILGQHIDSWNMTNIPTLSNEMRIPIKQIAEGAYIIKVETNTSKIINKKVIIKYH